MPGGSQLKHELATGLTMGITYQVNAPITTDQFIRVLEASSLAERRPVDDRECIAEMLANSNLVVSAWTGEQLVGVARSITDFHYACYLSDLAVAQTYQKLGIGKRLQAKTQDQLGPKCKLIVIAAPAVNAYYKRLGFTSNPRCWVLARDEQIRS